MRRCLISCRFKHHQQHKSDGMREPAKVFPFFICFIFSPLCLRARPGHLALDDLKLLPPPPHFSVIIYLPSFRPRLSSSSSFTPLRRLSSKASLSLSLPLSCRLRLLILSKLPHPRLPTSTPLPAVLQGTAGLSIIKAPVRGHFTQDPSYCTKIARERRGEGGVQEGWMQ